MLDWLGLVGSPYNSTSLASNGIVRFHELIKSSQGVVGEKEKVGEEGEVGEKEEVGEKFGEEAFGQKKHNKWDFDQHLQFYHSQIGFVLHEAFV